MKRFTLLFSLVISSIIYGQYDDLGTWNILNLKYNHSPSLSFFGEGQIRSLSFYNNFHYYEVKGGVNYKANKSLNLTLGAGTYQTYKEGGNFVTPKNNNEIRIWPQITLSQSIGPLKIEQRYRLELRFTSKGYKNRFRYRLGISYPFGKEKNSIKPFQAFVNNELFFSNYEPYFERNRLLVGLGYKITPKSSIQVGVLHQFDYKINDEIGRTFLQVGYYLEFTKKTKN